MTDGSRRLFIAGAMKAGTSALADALGRHPEIYTPWSAEPGYYYWRDRHPPTGPGDEIGYSTSVTSELEYEKLFSGAKPDQTLLDGSTQYYVSVPSLGAIVDAHPEAHVVVCLREPVARAISAYSHLRRDGREPLSFSEALRAEPDRRSDGWEPLWWYRQGSDYATAIRELEGRLREGHLHLVLFERMIEDPSSTLLEIYSKLGHDPSIVDLTFEEVNASGSPILRPLYRLLSATTERQLRVKQALPESLVSTVRRLRSNLLRSLDIEIDEVEVERLRDEFAPMVKFLGRRGLPVDEYWIHS